MKFDHLNDAKFYEVMALLAEQSGQDTNDFKDRIYAEGLSEYTIEQIQQAVWALVKTRTFSSFPKIAEILELMSGKTEDHAQVQAAIVWQAIGRHGAIRSVVFDDPVTMAVIQQGFGGWQKMCGELMVDQQQRFIKDFARHYGAFRRSGIVHYGMLAGWADPKGVGPVLIGDQQKAQAVLERGSNPEKEQIGVNFKALAEKMAV